MYYQNKPRFNGVYSRDNLPDKIRYVIMLMSIETLEPIGSHYM